MQQNQHVALRSLCFCLNACDLNRLPVRRKAQSGYLCTESQWNVVVVYLFVTVPVYNREIRILLLRENLKATPGGIDVLQ